MDNNEKMTTWVILFFIVLTLLAFLMTGCADVTPVQECIQVAGGHTYGFWGGLWHGMIAGWSWVGSWFSNDIAVWAINNNGGWYTFGFLLGIGSLSGTLTGITKLFINNK